MQRGRSVINTTVGSCVYVGVKLSALHCVLTHQSLDSSQLSGYVPFNRVHWYVK